MNCKICYLIYFLIAICFIYSIALANDKKKPPTVEIIEIDTIPKGFENLESQPRDFYVDVMFNAKKLTTVKVNFNPVSQTVLIYNPTPIMRQLHNVKYKEELLSMLKKRMPAHLDKVCKNNPSEHCGFIIPDKIAVILDPNKYTLELFIGKKYYTKTKRAPYLFDNPYDGFSYRQQFQANISGSDNADDDNYNFNTLNILGYRKSKAEVGLSLAQTGSQESYRLDPLFASTNYDHYQVNGGFFQTPGDLILQSQDILGASWGTNFQNFANHTETFSTPLEVFLPIASRVSVFRFNRLIFSQFYPAGNQIIDTSTFPQGSYNIVIETTNEYNQTETQERFFVKNSLVPIQGYPLYEIAGGVINTNNFNEDLFPQVGKDPFFSTFYSIRASNNIALQSLFTGTNSKAYLSLGAIYFGNYQSELSTQLTGGTTGEYGIGMSWGMQKEPFYMNSTTRYIYRPSPSETLDIFDYNPIRLSGLFLTTQISYAFDKLMMNLNMLYNYPQDSNQAHSYSIGPSVRYPFKFSSYDRNYLELSLTKSQDNFTVLLSVKFNFTHHNLFTTITPGVKYTDDTPDDNARRIEPTIAISSSYDIRTQDYAHLSLNAGYSQDSFVKNLFFSPIYRSELGRLQLELSQTYGDPDLFQYSGSYFGQATYSSGQWDLGGHQSGVSGVLIQIEENDDTDNSYFQILANGYVIETVKVNEIKTVFLAPYQSYDISIRPYKGNTFKQYDNIPKNITLYPGNFAYLNWKIKPKIILLTTLYDINKKPLINAFLTNTEEPAITLEEGFLQAEVSPDLTELEFILPNDDKCNASLPKDKTITDNYLDIPYLICK